MHCFYRLALISCVLGEAGIVLAASVCVCLSVCSKTENHLSEIDVTCYESVMVNIRSDEMSTTYELDIDVQS